MKTLDTIDLLNPHEMNTVYGGATGDAAFLIGRTYVWTTAHIFTFGLSTLYLISNNSN